MKNATLIRDKQDRGWRLTIKASPGFYAVVDYESDLNSAQAGCTVELLSMVRYMHPTRRLGMEKWLCKHVPDRCFKCRGKSD